MEAIYLDCGARRPQLKRTPLDGCHVSPYQVVRKLLSPDKQWRAEIFRRPGSTFGFRVFKLHVDEVVGAHWDMVSKHSEAVLATPDEAARELRARVARLANASVAAV